MKRNALLVCLLAALAAAGTGGGIKGRITDSSGAVIPSAVLTATPAAGAPVAATTDPSGNYSLAGLAPGDYTVRVAFPGFKLYQSKVTVAAGRVQALDISLEVSMEKQEVTVKGEPGAAVSTEPDNNAGALVLRGEDLDSLPDDPDDLAADLQALAGPSAGPNGGQIFIDGFSGGRLPPKESIREIRINQNPFSAEYDKLGFGRIEIFTKPGSDKFRGQAFMNFSDALFNSRNPFAPNKPDFQSRMFGGNLSGPLGRKASFFVDLEKRDIDDNAVVNATLIDPSTLGIASFREAVVTPNRRTTVSPRLDYQLTPKITLTGRYTWSHIGQDNAGIGEFSLLSRAYETRDTQHAAQFTETGVLGPRAVNETRFQYVRARISDLGDNSQPAINVLESFQGGGAQIGRAWNSQNHYELQNYTSYTAGKHMLRFGARLRTDTLANFSPQNFGGTFIFGGGFAPALQGTEMVLDAQGQPVMQTISSLERYRRTLYLLQAGLSAAQVRALGGGATQFSISGGNPLADISQTDLGAFLQDDWRVRSNLTLSMGLRYETQTNIHDWRDFGPRLGVAWSPGTKSRTVFRGGFGMFYDRFAENLTLQALRYNGLNQQQYIVINPEFFPTPPPLAALAASRQPLTVWQVSGKLRAPYIMQTAVGVERQLPWNTTIATTYTNSRGLHLLRARNVNAPLPQSGIRPDPAAGNIDLYESSGVLHQNQWITNVNSRVNPNVSLFAFYVLNYARSNTDSAGSFPADQYNLAGEYGRSSLDVRHRFVLGGSVMGPLGVRFSPFIIARSGSPFNITTGRDNNGDTVFTDRPALAMDLSKPGVVITRFGAFDPNPGPGAVMIPRNYGEGPGWFTVNLRLSRTFGFGGSAANRPAGMGGEGGRHFGGHGGPGGPGGMRMGGGMHALFAEGSSEHRYNVTVSLSARNLLNHVNLASPIGNLSSPDFGQSIATAGGWGPMGSMANNRRVEMQVRFSF